MNIKIIGAQQTKIYIYKNIKKYLHLLVQIINNKQ